MSTMPWRRSVISSPLLTSLSASASSLVLLPRLALERPQRAEAVGALSEDGGEAAIARVHMVWVGGWESVADGRRGTVRVDGSAGGLLCAKREVWRSMVMEKKTGGVGRGLEGVRALRAR